MVFKQELEAKIDRTPFDSGRDPSTSYSGLRPVKKTMLPASHVPSKPEHTFTRYLFQCLLSMSCQTSIAENKGMQLIDIFRGNSRDVFLQENDICPQKGRIESTFDGAFGRIYCLVSLMISHVLKIAETID